MEKSFWLGYSELRGLFARELSCKECGNTPRMLIPLGLTKVKVGYPINVLFYLGCPKIQGSQAKSDVDLVRASKLWAQIRFVKAMSNWVSSPLGI
jgi:hypothetical protein